MVESRSYDLDRDSAPRKTMKKVFPTNDGRPPLGSFSIVTEGDSTYAEYRDGKVRVEPCTGSRKECFYPTDPEDVKYLKR